MGFLADLSQAIDDLRLKTEDTEYVLDLTGYVDIERKKYIGGGSYGDVYRGRWDKIPNLFTASTPPDIAIKVFRGLHVEDLEQRKTVFKVGVYPRLEKPANARYSENSTRVSGVERLKA